MNVTELLTAWLKEHGYDGLCRDGCGCDVDNLAPCGEYCGYCVPAYKRTCPGHDKCAINADCEDLSAGDTCYCSVKE